MKLVTQTVLVFVEGRSEKVYEVDLCEVGAGRFVVNFRYGKKGAALKDGSKTVAPVSRAEADRVFEKLVSTKVEQGYVREAEAEAARLRAQDATARATASAAARSAGRPADAA
ncbi:MAG TPA: WGR domain-containing protein, partial [Polyangiaceae bacterium]|nr:WGR domain-containing protein [Polyangiaceae bacterium]